MKYATELTKTVLRVCNCVGKTVEKSVTCVTTLRTVTIINFGRAAGERYQRYQQQGATP